MNHQLPPPDGGKGPRINTDLIREVQNRHNQTHDRQGTHRQQDQYHYHQYNTYQAEPTSGSGSKKDNTVALTVILAVSVLVGLFLVVAIGGGSQPEADEGALGVGSTAQAIDAGASGVPEAALALGDTEDLGPSDEELDERFNQARREAIVAKYQATLDDGSGSYYYMSNQTDNGRCRGDKLLAAGAATGALPFERNGTYPFILYLSDNGGPTGKMIIGRMRLNKPDLKLQGAQEGTYVEDEEAGLKTDLRPADDVNWKNLPLQFAMDGNVPNYTRFKVNGVNYQLCIIGDGSGEASLLPNT